MIEDKIEPIEYIDKAKLSEDELNRYKELGETVIKEGKLAVLTMAGGQGTRLRTQWTKRNFYASE